MTILLDTQEPMGDHTGPCGFFSDLVLAEELKGPIQEPPNSTTGDTSQDLKFPRAGGVHVLHPPPPAYLSIPLSPAS